MRTGTAAKFELSWDVSGKQQYWYVRAVPEYDANGVIQSGLTIWRDISETKAAEVRLRESYDMLRELASRREMAREEERKRERKAASAAESDEIKRLAADAIALRDELRE